MKVRVYDLVTEHPDFFELIGGPAKIEFEGVSDDTRDLKPGQLFVALKGPNSDGHEYCTKAIIGGATTLLVERERPAPGHIAVIRCADSVLGYLKLGSYLRQQSGVGVVAVTGTVGKTTVRQMIAAMLDMTGPTAVNEENQNAETGVARVLCSLPGDYRTAVIEMGMRDIGEIDLLCRHALPDTGVITHVTPCHLDKLGTIEAVAAAKGELNRFLAESERPCLINAEAACLDELTALNPDRTLLYGKRDGCARMAMHSSGAAFYLDGYNASPASLDAALKHVAGAVGYERRVAVLGDMLELGEDTASFHAKAGFSAAELGFDELLAYGPLALHAADMAQSMGVRTSHFDDHAALNAAISNLLAPGTIVLVKGSNGMRLWDALEGFELD